jgi:hypothetical protein
LILSAVAMVELIREIVVKMQKNPIIFYIDDEAISVTEINFPAVSLCPGLVLKTTNEMLIDYNTMKRSFEKELIDRSNFTDSEYE